jgi:flagellar biosynthesis/type III secretory pathway protein FliH
MEGKMGDESLTPEELVQRVMEAAKAALVTKLDSMLEEAYEKGFRDGYTAGREES